MARMSSSDRLVDAVEVGAGQDAARGRPCGWASRSMVLPRPGHRAAPACGGVPVDGPADDGRAGHRAEDPAVGAGLGGRRPPPRGCPARRSTAATRLIRMRSGCRGSRTATTSPGSGQDGGPQGGPPPPDGRRGAGPGPSRRRPPRPAGPTPRVTRRRRPPAPSATGAHRSRLSARSAAGAGPATAPVGGAGGHGGATVGYCARTWVR